MSCESLSEGGVQLLALLFKDLFACENGGLSLLLKERFPFENGVLLFNNRLPWLLYGELLLLLPFDLW